MEILVVVLIFVVFMAAMTGKKTDEVIKQTMSGQGSSDHFAGFGLMLLITVVVFVVLVAMAESGGLDETWEITGGGQTNTCYINCD